MISEYTRIVNLLGFWICQDYTRIWITYFMIGVWQHSEYALDFGYAKVLIMLGLHMILNSILQHRYLTVYWICLVFWICHFYTRFCRKRPITNVWLFLSILRVLNLRAWICKGCEFSKIAVFWRFTVFWMPWVLNILRFRMYQESKYAIVTKSSK